MIIAFTQTTAHKFGDAMSSMYKLRYRQFIERQSYETFSYKNYEYDQYDTPATIYLVYRDIWGNVRGLSRIAPTDRPYMIKDLWPDMVTEIELPKSVDVWESTRFCIDKTVNRKLRASIKAELLCAGLEYGLKNGIKFYVGVMPPAIWASVFIRSGWSIETIGDVKQLQDGSRVVAAAMPVSEDILDNVREKSGIKASTLVDQFDFRDESNWQTLFG